MRVPTNGPATRPATSAAKVRSTATATITRTAATLAAATLLSAATTLPTSAQTPPSDRTTFRSVLSAMPLREVGPAVAGGRIADIAVHPGDRSTWYVAVGSGGLWKTTNAGTTWTPVFDDQPSYSIGVVTLDPTNPETVWVGTGENVSGRHVAWGSGV